MWKALILTLTLAFTSVMLSGCSDEQNEQMGQDNELDADAEWSKNPYDENADEAENPEPTEEINRQKDDNDLMESTPDEENGLDEATEQGVGQQY